MKSILIALAFAMVAVSSFAQTKRTTTPKRTSAKLRSAATTPAAVPRGAVIGRTYSNRGLGFSITFPETWLIPGDDFAAYMKKAGYDITPKAPRAANATDQRKVDAAFNRLKILMTAYRSLPGTEGNAIARVAVENVRTLDTNRPVKDAVDYVDLMRSQMGLVKMPSGYTYSETQAERLGSNQFAYIDSSDHSQKTRVYVTVRGSFAILFSLNYTSGDDLETFRDALARATFTTK